MTEEKKSLYERMYGDKERALEARAEARLDEAREKAIYHLHVYQGYERRDASDIVHELSPNWTPEEIEETIRKGITDKIREEAIALLTERDAPRRTKIEDACNQVITYLHIFRGYDREEISQAVQKLSQEWTKEKIEEINRFNTRQDSRDARVITDIERILIERGALKKKSEGIDPSPS